MAGASRSMEVLIIVVLALSNFRALNAEAAPVAVVSPVPESLYPSLAVLLLTVGLVSTASFLIYEVTSSKFNRSLLREIITGGLASLFLGFGTLFLLLWTGVYV